MIVEKVDEPATLAALLAEHDVLEEQQRDAAQERVLLQARRDPEAKRLLQRNAIRMRALRRLSLTFWRRVALQARASNRAGNSPRAAARLLGWSSGRLHDHCPAHRREKGGGERSVCFPREERRRMYRMTGTGRRHAPRSPFTVESAGMEARCA